MNASKKSKGKIISEECKKKMRASSWTNNPLIKDAVLRKIHTPEANKKRYRSLIKTLIKKQDEKIPSNFEVKFEILCRRYNLPFRFTGNGSYWIRYNDKNKNPDFIFREKKIAIEVYHSFFKRQRYGNVQNYLDHCNKIYHNKGWQVVFIDENILEHENWQELCFDKILETINNQNPT